MVLPILLLALSLSFDALSAGFVYGVRDIKIPITSKLIISFFSVFYCAIAIFIGSKMSFIFSPSISKYIGASILIFMGIWIIIKSTKKPACKKNNMDICKTLFKLPIKPLGVTINIIKNPSDLDIDNSGTIENFESFLLSIALSLDAVGAGIGCSLLSINSLYMPLAIGFFQIIFLTIGTTFGHKFRTCKFIHSNFIKFLPGIILIILAILKLFL